MLGKKCDVEEERTSLAGSPPIYRRPGGRKEGGEGGGRSFSHSPHGGLVRWSLGRWHGNGGSCPMKGLALGDVMMSRERQLSVVRLPTWSRKGKSTVHTHRDVVASGWSVRHGT